MSVQDSALGRNSALPRRYSPDVLYPIARADARANASIGLPLPFSGVDVWNAWELTWLNPGGKPSVAACEIRVPADSPNLIESKSLKLYLGSCAMTEFAAASVVCETIERDLSAAAGATVTASLGINGPIAQLDGRCIDDLDIECNVFKIDAELLLSDASRRVDEELHTHLLRSLCPVTSQPDMGSVQLRYSGPRIDPASLLRYVVSFREHNDFHEACVERIFVDILERCQPEKLSVYARYQRRGGIDINPFRSNFEGAPANSRLWRQ